MENQAIRFTIQSLKQIALKRVTILLWTGPDVIASLEKSNTMSLYFKNCLWERECERTFEKKVFDKMLRLLPESLRKEIMLLIRPVGLQIKNWVKFHEDYLSCTLCTPILAKLCWTTSGIIDYCKTAKEILHYEVLDIKKCYDLAHLYCLDNYKFGLNSDPPARDLRKGLYSAVLRGNKAATESFFHKLKTKRKDLYLYNATEKFLNRLKSIRNCGEFPSEQTAENFSYILSLMNHKQQLKILHKFPFKTLRLFIDWPFKGLFFQIADIVWDFLTEEDYFNLANEISERFTTFDYYFHMLFQEFYFRSPAKLRKSVADQQTQGNFLCLLLWSLYYSSDCEEALQLFFGDIEISNRVRLLSSKYMLSSLGYCIVDGNCNLLKVCLREAMLTNDDKETVRNACNRFIVEENMFKQPVMNIFLHCLDGTSLEMSSIEYAARRSTERFSRDYIFAILG